jgi:hypothetical protein
VLILRACLSGDGDQECGQQESQPGYQPPEVVSGGGQDSVDRVTGRASEVVAAHPMFFGVADDRFDGEASAQFALDIFGDAPTLAGDIEVEAMIGRGALGPR